MGTNTEALLERVARAALTSESGLLVERTDDGFDVRRDQQHPRWENQGYERSMRHTVIHHVAVDETRNTYTITDDVRQVSVQRGEPGGAPRIVLRASGQRSLGRFRSIRRSKQWELQPDGQLRPTTVTLDSDVGRRLIEQEAEALGLRQRMNTWTKVGLAVGAVGIIGALVAMVLAVVVTASVM